MATFGDNAIWIIDTTTNQAEPLVQDSFFAPWFGPWGLALTPDGSRIIVLNRDSDNVGLINVNTGQPEATVAVGSNPESSAFDPELPQAIVTNSGSNDVTFVNTDDGTASFASVGHTPVAVVTTLQPPELLQPGDLIAALESPEPGPVSGVAVIRGWAAATHSEEQIRNVELFIDDVPSGNLPCCSEREDVQAAFPQLSAQNTLSSGWGGTLNWGVLSSGTHTIRVEVRSTTGKLFSTETRAITVVKPGDFEFLDRFSLANATARIVGDELGVEGIVVRDKASQQQKTINTRFRWSTSAQSLQMVKTETVATAFSSRSRFAKILASLLTRVTGLSAATAVEAASGIEHFFESPEEKQVVSGVAVIRGWAFPSAQGAVLNDVRLLIDGMPSSPIPCCSQRSDVAARYPGNANALHSGWGFAINYGNLPAGKHTIGVRLGDSLGSSLTAAHEVTVVKVGGFEFLDQFDLSAATARIEGEELVLSGVQVHDKATRQIGAVTVRLRWFESSQSLGVVASEG